MTDPNLPQPHAGQAQPAPGQPYQGQPYPGQAQPAYQGQPEPGQPYPGQPDGYHGAPQGTWPAPPQKKKGKGLLIGLVAGGAALLLLIAAAVVFVVTVTAANSPAAKAEAVLKALVARDAEQAATLLGVEPGPLVSNEFYASVPNAIESYRVLDVLTSDDNSLVSVEIVQESATSTVDLPLVRTKQGWQLDAVLPTLGTVVYGPSDGLSTTINGSDLGLAASELETITLLPGDYEIALTDPSGLTESSPLTVNVVGLAGSDGITLDPSAGIDVALTPEGALIASAAVNDHIAACIAQPVLSPIGGCGWGVRAGEGETNTSIVWTLTVGPTISIGGWNGTGWDVTTDAPGSASMTCQFSDPSGTGDCWADAIGVDAIGTVIDLTADGATFVSDYE